MFFATLMIMSVLPTQTTEVQAAAVRVYNMYPDAWNVSDCTVDNMRVLGFQVEAKQSFSVAHLYTAYTSNQTTTSLSELSGVKYSSDNASIASVNSSGKVTTKKAGDTVIRMSRDGIKAACYIKVVKTGTLGLTSTKYKAIRKYTDTLAGYANKKISLSNCYTIANAQTHLYDARLEAGNFNDQGFARKYGKNVTIKGVRFTDISSLIVPKQIELKIDSKMQAFANQYNPTIAGTKNSFVISKASAKKNSKTISVTLKQKVTAAQIFALKKTGSDAYISNDKTAEFTIYIVDTKTSHRYYGTAVVKQGSNKLTITMNYLKLKAGRTYQLRGGYYSYSASASTEWTKGKKVTAK